MNFKSVKRRKVHEDVAEQIEAAIVNGTFSEGDNLPSERDLMESFSVGRPAVREALLLLERSGLIQLTTGGRARVVRPTVAALINQLAGTARHFMATPGGEESFQDARRLFEAAIARNAADIATEADLTRLSAALDANRAALNDMAAFERTDVAFHFVLASIGNNPVFAALHSGIADWLSLQRHISLRIAGAAERALRSHEAIFAAVAARKPEAAWQAMDEHLRDVMQFYRRSSVSI